eukprot:4921629-Prymnesium_polylepis.1
MEGFIILAFVGESKSIGAGRPDDTNTTEYQRTARVVDVNKLDVQDHFPTGRMRGEEVPVIEGVAFLFFYMALIVMVVLVLINLLIAMMSQTYANVITTAELEWRVMFAQLVLKLEMLAFGTPLPCIPGKASRN